ncbi:hypothetical protein [Rhizobium sullae]|uniref:Uncharacterized protein n=1 Tax=Rhizobium sullae TaxID=50338 RepID=A0A4R3PU01_RHISU|nr:hypothetical protein [Rhizobium sullae]TCU08672.1 hypothetical protein EV132_12660 [Rhizobium sullae]
MLLSPFFQSNWRTRTLHATAKRYPNTLAPSVEILRNYCANSLPSLVSDPYECWIDQFEALGYDLAKFVPQDRSGYYYLTFLEAQSGFATQDCLLPCHEDGLTALLKRRVIDAVAKLNVMYSSQAEASGHPTLYIADLNVRGRERRTGGDIAFVFDVGSQYVCHCFQAKRTNIACNDPVDIRRGEDRDHDGGDQLRRLSRLAEVGVLSSYLFYNNDFEDRTEEPSAPIAKCIAHLLVNEEAALDVYLNTDCCDMASYILRSVGGDLPEANLLDYRDLGAVIDALVREDVTHIVAVGNDSRSFDLVCALANDRGLVQRPIASLRTGEIDFQAVANAAQINWDIGMADADNVATLKFR